MSQAQPQPQIPTVAIPASLVPTFEMSGTVQEIFDLAAENKAKVLPAFVALAKINTDASLSAIISIAQRHGNYLEAVNLAIDMMIANPQLDRSRPVDRISHILSGWTHRSSPLDNRDQNNATALRLLELLKRDQTPEGQDNFNKIFRASHLNNKDYILSIATPGNDAAVPYVLAYEGAWGSASEVNNAKLRWLSTIDTPAAITAMGQVALEAQYSYDAVDAIAAKGVRALPALESLSQTGLNNLSYVAYLKIAAMRSSQAKTVATRAHDQLQEKFRAFAQQVHTFIDDCQQRQARITGADLAAAFENFTDSSARHKLTPASIIQCFSFLDVDAAVTAAKKLAVADPHNACEALAYIGFRRGLDPNKLGYAALQSIGSRTAAEALFNAMYGRYLPAGVKNSIQDYRDALPFLWGMGSVAHQHIIDAYFIVPCLELAEYKAALANPESPETFERALALRGKYSHWGAVARRGLLANPSADNIDLFSHVNRGEYNFCVADFKALGSIKTEEAAWALYDIFDRSVEFNTQHIKGIVAYRQPGVERVVAEYGHRYKGNDLFTLQLLIKLRKATDDQQLQQEIAQLALPFVKAVARPTSLYPKLAKMTDDERGQLRAVFRILDAGDMVPEVPKGHFVRTFNAMIRNCDERRAQADAFKDLFGVKPK